jgi:hypothetical protein
MYLDKRVLKVALDDNEDLESIQFLLDANEVYRNTVILCIPLMYRTPSYLDHYRFLSEACNFAEEDILLHKDQIKKYSTLALEGEYAPGEWYPFYFSFLQKRKTIRESLDSICEKGVLTSEDRYHIEDALVKYEKALEFANSRTSETTIAQKDLLCTFIEPYLETLEEKLSKEEILTYVKDLVWAWSLLSFDSFNSLDDTYRLLRHSSRHRGTHLSAFVDDESLESLIAIARVPAGHSNLETALLQCGSTLPNKETILHLIEEKIG